MSTTTDPLNPTSLPAVLAERRRRELDAVIARVARNLPGAGS